MKIQWKVSILSALLLLSLSACNSDNHNINPQNEVDIQPVRYENDSNLHEDINQNNTRGKTPFHHDETPRKTDERLEKGGDLEFNKNRGAE
jgi:hypothetical protein